MASTKRRRVDIDPKFVTRRSVTAAIKRMFPRASRRGSEPPCLCLDEAVVIRPGTKPPLERRRINAAEWHGALETRDCDVAVCVENGALVLRSVEWTRLRLEKGVLTVVRAPIGVMPARSPTRLRTGVYRLGSVTLSVLANWVKVTDGHGTTVGCSLQRGTILAPDGESGIVDGVVLVRGQPIDAAIGGLPPPGAARVWELRDCVSTVASFVASGRTCCSVDAAALCHGVSRIHSAVGAKVRITGDAGHRSVLISSKGGGRVVSPDGAEHECGVWSGVPVAQSVRRGCAARQWVTL
jgi:hypothetical protein